jgi:perosamine synthetase
MIPVSEPFLGQREAENVADCLRSGWISSAGTYIDEFESSWASYCGRRFGIAVSNGTVALQLAVAALDLKPGDEVIIPTFTIVSCALAVIYAGATPVLVDADPSTWGMDVGQIEAKITPRTRAIMPVHIYGHPMDMDPVLELAARHGLVVIEDAAEAHGAEYRSATRGWVRCGNFGEMSSFSFYANKLVTTGEGGMVLTDDPGLAERLRSLRNLAFQSGRRFRHDELGFNFRMTNVQAAIGVAQVERMAETVSRKVALARRYAAGLEGLSGIRLQTEASWARSVWWMNGLVLDHTDITAEELGQELRARDVETRPFFLGMHRQPALLKRGLFGGESYPVADELAAYGLYLPSGTGLSPEQADQVIASVQAVLP